MFFRIVTGCQQASSSPTRIPSPARDPSQTTVFEFCVSSFFRSTNLLAVRISSKDSCPHIPVSLLSPLHHFLSRCLPSSCVCPPPLELSSVVGLSCKGTLPSEASRSHSSLSLNSQSHPVLPSPTTLLTASPIIIFSNIVLAECSSHATSFCPS